MSDKKNQNSEFDELGVFIVVGIIAFIILAIIIPITIISLPLAILLRSLMNEEKYLSRYSFGLMIGAITYFFLFGVNFIEFNGIIFRSFGDSLNLLLTK